MLHFTELIQASLAQNSELHNCTTAELAKRTGQLTATQQMVGQELN